MGEIFANPISDKDIVSRTYKEHSQFNNKKKSNSIQNCTKNLNRHFSKEDVQMVNKYTKQCSTSSVFREMQIKIIIR